MHSVISEKQAVAAVVTYPRLMRFKGKMGSLPYVLLETSAGSGVVIWSQNSDVPVGDYEWMGHHVEGTSFMTDNTDEFEVFNGSITLSN